jgi:hypothetical protein
LGDDRFIFIARINANERFKERFEEFLIGAMSEYSKAEVAEANQYMDYVQHWRSEVERLLFVQVSFLIDRTNTNSPFDKRQAVEEVIEEYNPPEEWKSLLSAKKAIAVRYLKDPHATLKLPDVQISHHSF